MRRCAGFLLAMVLSFIAGQASAGECAFSCGDLTGDHAIALDDYVEFADCLGLAIGAAPQCACADLDGSGVVDLFDAALFMLVFAEVSDETPPACTGAIGSTANLTAYRPQHGAGYAPFARTAVAEIDEESPITGPGIRINSPGDNDPAGEDDLIEVVLDVAPAGAPLALRRSQDALRVWTTRSKSPGTEVAFSGDKTGALPIGETDHALTFWVEWALPVHGVATLTVEPVASGVVKDALVFHSFSSVVIALGGENQVPIDPPNSNLGTFVVAVDLYRAGYDVHMYDEDHVTADGSGAVYNEVVHAIQHRGVETVGIFGYSHGGGSTYDLAERLDIHRAGIGVFEIEFTSYVDSVSNNSDFDTAQELRRPPSTQVHVNHYQRGSFFEDLGLDGGPVPNSLPPPTGLDVETTPWGAGATHFEVDDFVEVRVFIMSTLIANISF